jgi:hypothetical protein
MATGRVPTTANSPLTAKGDLFGYSTTQARVAVGNDGETLVADSSATTGLRYQANFAAGKNKIINGDMGVWQRGTSFTITGGINQFTADRFFTGSSITTTITRETFTPGSAPIAGYESTFFLQAAVAANSGASDYSITEQRIEDVRQFAGQTMTFSFWAKAASGTPQIALEVQQNFGSGGSATVSTPAGAVTLSTSWARYSFTVAVPSVSGKTIGTTSYLTCLLWLTGGSTWNTRASSIGNQTNTFSIWGVQAEASNTATAFQTATGTLQGELAACQRYYQRFSGSTVATGFASSTTVAQFVLNHKVSLRNATVSLGQNTMGAWDVTSFYSGGTWAVAANNNDASGIGFSRITYTHGSAVFTQFRPYLLQNNDANSWLEVSAEL